MSRISFSSLKREFSARSRDTSASSSLIGREGACLISGCPARARATQLESVPFGTGAGCLDSELHDQVTSQYDGCK